MVTGGCQSQSCAGILAVETDRRAFFLGAALDLAQQLIEERETAQLPVADDIERIRPGNHSEPQTSCAVSTIRASLAHC